MPTLCVQCAMRALVDGKPVPTFEETPEEHQRRCHPDLRATQKERIELEKRLEITSAMRLLDERNKAT